MKCKFLAVSLISLLLLSLFQNARSVSAEVVADADIPVCIEGGGTAYIIPEVNSPLPTQDSIRVDNGRTGHFYIHFTETGIFHYSVTAGFPRNGEEIPSQEVFRLKITVYEQGGMLQTVTTLGSNLSTTKPDLIFFRETSETVEKYDKSIPYVISEENTLSPPTAEDAAESGEESSDSGLFGFFKAPKTGDESHLIDYLLAAIASSAGLFGLGLLYTINTNRLIKRKIG